MYNIKRAIAGFLAFVLAVASILFAYALGKSPPPPELAYPVPMAQFGALLLAIMLLGLGFHIWPIEGFSFRRKHEAELNGEQNK